MATIPHRRNPNNPKGKNMARSKYTPTRLENEKIIATALYHSKIAPKTIAILFDWTLQRTLDTIDFQGGK